MFAELRCRHALLLQGPNGPFFRRLARELETHRIRATKINLNAGDALFYGGTETLNYRGRLEDFGAYLDETIRARGIDGLFLFGDSRPYHVEARRIALTLGLPVWVFEEGYLRPHYITLEKGGVNGFSSMPRDPGYYRDRFAAQDSQHDERDIYNAPKFTFAAGALHSSLYSLALTFAGNRFPHYRHHRPLNAWREAACWLRGGLRKVWFQAAERSISERLKGPLSGKYFLHPLQVHCDAQFEHAPFDTPEQVMEHLMASFAQHAPSDVSLVIKHHPMDRAYRDYSGFIRALQERHGLRDRVFYVHDLHLPTLLKNARGTVLMNSTVGISSLFHGTPVKALGSAVFGIDGLTASCSLEEFWTAPPAVDTGLFQAFRRSLLELNQFRGSFHVRTRPETSTGVQW